MRGPQVKFDDVVTWTLENGWCMIDLRVEHFSLVVDWDLKSGQKEEHSTNACASAGTFLPDFGKFL